MPSDPVVITIPAEVAAAAPEAKAKATEIAPADISLQIFSRGKIVSEQTGITATIRRTLGQGVAALMWSVRMIGVALAFLVPWALTLGLVGWLVSRIARRRGSR